MLTALRCAAAGCPLYRPRQLKVTAAAQQHASGCLVCIAHAYDSDRLQCMHSSRLMSTVVAHVQCHTSNALAEWATVQTCCPPWVTLLLNMTAYISLRWLPVDTVFVSFADLCAFRPLTLKEFCNAAIYAGLNSTLNSNKLDATVFVPNSRYGEHVAAWPAYSCHA